MKAMIRLVVVSFLAALVTVGAGVQASPSAAEKGGSASGTLEFHGKSISIRNAVAVTRPAHDGNGSEYLVILGAAPAAGNAIGTAKSLDDVRGEGTKGMTGVIVLIREGLDPWVELRDPSIQGQAGVTATFVPTARTADRIAGKLTGQTEHNGKPVKFNISFDAPVIRKLAK